LSFSEDRRRGGTHGEASPQQPECNHRGSHWLVDHKVPCCRSSFSQWKRNLESMTYRTTFHWLSWIMAGERTALSQPPLPRLSSGSGATAPTGLLTAPSTGPPFRGALTPVPLVQREYHLPVTPEPVRLPVWTCGVTPEVYAMPALARRSQSASTLGGCHSPRAPALLRNRTGPSQPRSKLSITRVSFDPLNQVGGRFLLGVGVL
jgi:hypothetical protein